MYLARYYTTSVALLFSLTMSAPALALPTSLGTTVDAETLKGSLPLPVHVVQEFPKGTWLQNLAIRPNDQILVTTLTGPEIYQVDPLSKRTPQLVYSFPNVTSSLGITEVEHDIFYVAVGTFSFATFMSRAGSFSVWKVDMSSFSVAENTAATVSKVVDLPHAKFLNGATTLSKEDGLILVSDSSLGVVWRVNVHTGEVIKIIDDPAMKPGATSGFGINGIKLRESSLYFTNGATQTFNKIPIKKDGSAAGAASIRASNIPGDDFQFDKSGNAIIAFNILSEVERVPAKSGQSRVIAGSPQAFDLAGPTAVEFGRNVLDSTSVYVTSTGGISAYLSGNFTVGGRVNRIDLELYDQN